MFWGGKDGKGKESCVTASGSRLNFSSCLRAPRRDEERAGEGREETWCEICDILIRENCERAGDLETPNSSCLLKSRTFPFFSSSF